MAEKTAHDRETGHAGAGDSKASLYAEAKKRDVPGRSKMSKAELQKALGRGR